MPPAAFSLRLEGSTYRSVRLASSLAAALPAERRVLARRGWAGEMSGLFEHPVWRSIAIVIANVLKNETSAYLGSFQQTPSPS